MAQAASYECFQALYPVPERQGIVFAQVLQIAHLEAVRFSRFSTSQTGSRSLSGNT